LPIASTLGTSMPSAGGVHLIIKGLLVLAATRFRKTHDLDELSAAALPLYPDLEPLLAYVRVRTYWGFAFRYPMPGTESGPPAKGEIEATLRHLSQLRARLAAAMGL